MTGLDRTVIEEIDWKSAVRNIIVDTRSDFILSPQFDGIYLKNSERLIETTLTALRSGTYDPRLPITFSVPKSNFLTRPGSILEPKDRLIHQAAIESCLPRIEEQLDRSRSFSQVPSAQTQMLFEPPHLGWVRFQDATKAICETHPYVLKADIANYFETIPQHPIVNSLTASGVQPELVSLIENQLLAFRHRSSTGIIQGIYPSDLLGNFYLSDFDGDCDLHDLASARYVDDIYVGFPDLHCARKELVRLTERLRQNGLSLNAQKTYISESENIIFEEHEIDFLFDEARAEIENSLELLNSSGYGFQGDWLNETVETEDSDIELNAIRHLMFLEDVTVKQREKIERFCLPIMRGADDNSAVDTVLDNLSVRPQLTRIYASYLTHFAPSEPEVVRRISNILNADRFFCDYQRMYMVAAILNCELVESNAVRICLQWLESSDIGQETRALCAVFVAKFGNAQQKRAVKLHYENEESEYVRSAILYAAQYYPIAEKRSIKRAWGRQSELNALISDII